jgi:hypothetical protein
MSGTMNRLSGTRSRAVFGTELRDALDLRMLQTVPIPSRLYWVPSGTYLILKGIPTSLQQGYGLEEEEGAIYLRPDTEDGTSRGGLRFNNGALVQL